MRVLHIIDYFQPKLGYQETFLAKSQIEKGHTCRVITSERYAPILFKGNASQAILGNRIQNPGHFLEEGIDVVRLPVGFEILNNVWLKGLEEKILEFKPTIIHVHHICSCTAIRLALLKKKFKNTRFIFEEHMIFNASRGKWILPLYMIFKFFLSDIILKNADAIVACTDENKRFMEKMYGFPSDRIKIIPLGCDITKFYRDNNERKFLRNKYHISDDEVVFCYAGKIIPDKGVDLLVDASILLMESKKDIRVLIIGGKDERYFDVIKKKIDSSGFSDRFIFIPPLPNKELYKYYSMADVGVWPTQCSITMLEAMASELPVIISENSGATERVTDNYNGFIYKEGDISNIKEKMEMFLDITIRNEMSKNAREVAEGYDWNKISLEFEKLYRGGIDE